MLLAFIRLVKELRPRWFLMENVPGLTHANNRELLATIFQEFESIDGYTVSGDVLLAADHGVAQVRYRLFIIGTDTASPIRFPEKNTETSASIQNSKAAPSLSRYPTVRDAIFDLAKYAPNENGKKAQTSQANDCPANHHCSDITKANRRRIQTIRPGEDWRHMPIQLLPEGYFATRASDQKGAYGRLLWDWPAYTITNSCRNITAGVFTHPDQNRVISVREAARLQSFDDGHVFKGSVESQYRQVGNAVPPKLARAIAEAMLYCHYNRREAENWGRVGRLNLQVVLDALQGKASFPTLTPRQVHPSFDRRSVRKKSKVLKSTQNRLLTESAWDASRRLIDPHPGDTRKLRKLAEQPANCRAAKRAKTILQFLDGVPKRTIVEEANVSEASIRKWIDGYIQSGLEGWRAYHTPIEHIQSDDQLTRRIKESVTRVRRTLMSPAVKAADAQSATPVRLHMNGYLLKLVKRFGQFSVAELIRQVEDELSESIGTVYVGDLLAIADAVLAGKPSKPKREGKRPKYEPQRLLPLSSPS
jgi:DNA-cytosine methyltransferase